MAEMNGEEVDFTGCNFCRLRFGLASLSNKSNACDLYLWNYIEALKSSTLIHYFVCYKSTQ